MSYLYSVSDEVSLSGLDIVLIVIGVIFLIIGLVAAITVGVLLGMKINKCCGIHALLQYMYHHCLCLLIINFSIYTHVLSYRDGKMVVLACDWNWNSSFDHCHYLMASTTGI